MHKNPERIPVAVIDCDFLRERDRLIIQGRALGACMEDLEKAIALLEPLEKHHAPTATHCLRVGQLSGRIAARFQKDLEVPGRYDGKGGDAPRIALLGGAIHDIGKVGCPIDVLDTTQLDEKGYALIRPHVEIGYRMSAEMLSEPAEAMKHHHQFQENPYPTVLPTSRHRYSGERQTYHRRLGRVIALADFADALKTRDNDRFGHKHLTRGEKYACLAKYNQDVAEWIWKLEREHVIGF